MVLLFNDLDGEIEPREFIEVYLRVALHMSVLKTWFQNPVEEAWQRMLKRTLWNRSFQTSSWYRTFFRCTYHSMLHDSHSCLHVYWIFSGTFYKAVRTVLWFSMPNIRRYCTIGTHGKVGIEANKTIIGNWLECATEWREMHARGKNKFCLWRRLDSLLSKPPRLVFKGFPQVQSNQNCLGVHADLQRHQ